MQYDFPKMKEGGVKGRLKLFRKFIRFGDATSSSLSTFVKVAKSNQVTVGTRFVKVVTSIFEKKCDEEILAKFVDEH